MALFNFGKKKEKKTTSCTCNCGCSKTGDSKKTAACCPEAKNGICCVKVLGAGCRSCHQQYENAKEAVASVPRTNGSYPVGSRPSKTRYKNFVITQKLKDELLKCLSQNDSCVQTNDNMMFDPDDMF